MTQSFFEQERFKNEQEIIQTFSKHADRHKAILTSDDRYIMLQIGLHTVRYKTAGIPAAWLVSPRRGHFTTLSSILKLQKLGILAQHYSTIDGVETSLYSLRPFEEIPVVSKMILYKRTSPQLITDNSVRQIHAMD